MSETYKITATDNEDGLPDFFEVIQGYEVVKKTERLTKMGYNNIVIDGEDIRYVINDRINCSCLTYPPNKKVCKGCSSNISKTKSLKDFLKGIK